MHRVAPFAAEHHGVFDVVAALRCGLNRNDITLALRRGEIIRLHRSVYRFAGAPTTGQGRQLAACWAAGPHGFTSHRSAAALHEIPGGNRGSVIITCPRWRRAQHEGIVVHESSSWT